MQQMNPIDEVMRLVINHGCICAEHGEEAIGAPAAKREAASLDAIKAAIEQVIAAERAKLIAIVKAHDTGDMTREDMEVRRIVFEMEARGST